MIMRKLLLPLLSTLLFTACQKEIAKEQAPKVAEPTSGIAAKGPAGKLDVCHYDAVNGTHIIININVKAWPEHEGHGDVRLDDADGDGFVPENACGFGTQGDCDDNNAAIHPGATEVCGNSIDENCNGMSDDACSLSIGDPYKGGIIAYLDYTGWHGLIAAPYDQSEGAEWGCNLVQLPGADGTAIGTGNQNTIDIMAGCTEEGIAARICGDLVLDGYDDWYLPSKDELNILYTNREKIGGFSNYVYWSSSELPEINPGWVGPYYAFNQNFYSGGFYPGFVGVNTKNAINHVRAVRAF